MADMEGIEAIRREGVQEMLLGLREQVNQFIESVHGVENLLAKSIADIENLKDTLDDLIAEGHDENFDDENDDDRDDENDEDGDGDGDDAFLLPPLRATCECARAACEHCEGIHSINGIIGADAYLWRVNNPQDHGTAFCILCASSAIDSGQFQRQIAQPEVLNRD